MFTLDQARAFIAVAEETHFGRAAERLHMTQPPLSRQIQKLEHSLGVGLLVRHPRGVSLSAAGQAFLVECRQLVAQAEQAPRQARLIAAGQVGVVRLGYTATSAYGVLGALLADIKEGLPGVTVELHEMVSARQVEALRHGTIDMGLARPPFHLEGVESKLVLTEALVVALPRKHPLTLRGQPISAEELRDEPIIMHSHQHARYFRDLVVRLVDVRPEMVPHTATQVLTLVALSAAGHGLALVPESSSQFTLPGVEFLPLQESPADLVQLHAIWTSKSTNPALLKVTELIQDQQERCLKGI